MAYGDPMILTTLDLLENGPLETWANTSNPADGYAYWNSASPAATFSRQSGTRTGGSGSYYQRLVMASQVAGYQHAFYQRVALLGYSGLACRGHYGMTFTLNIWARKAGGGATMTIQPSISERDAGGELAYTRASAVALTSTWTKYTVSRTLTVTATTNLEFSAFIVCTVAGDGNATIDLDDYDATTTYTFARNPVLPDDQNIAVPFRKVQRAFSGNLLRARPGVAALAKHEKRLSFAMIARAQFEAFRSLWLLDHPLLWTPYHPHLPTTLNARWTGDFDFRILRTLSPEFYQGTMQLTEV